MQRDIDDWTITFVDTGLQSTIADRLRLVEPYLKGDEMFLANYSDGLTDFPLPEMIEEFSRRNGYASFLSVQPRTSSLDTVQMDRRRHRPGDQMHEGLRHLGERGLLRAAQGDFSLHQAQRGTGLRTLPAD